MNKMIDELDRRISNGDYKAEKTLEAVLTAEEILWNITDIIERLITPAAMLALAWLLF